MFLIQLESPLLDPTLSLLITRICSPLDSTFQELSNDMWKSKIRLTDKKLWPFENLPKSMSTKSSNVQYKSSNVRVQNIPNQKPASPRVRTLDARVSMFDTRVRTFSVPSQKLARTRVRAFSA